MRKVRIQFTLILSSLILVSSCTKISQANRFFFSSCPESGPEQELNFDINFPEFDLDQYYELIRNPGDRYVVSKEATIEYLGKFYPIYRISQNQHGNKPKLLVVAGVHGNEQAALLSIPRILDQLQAIPFESLAWDVSFLSPVNPVGAEFGSRYNKNGCDINRDFGEFNTEEARVIKNVIEDIKPDLVLAPHEGPQSGFFMIATSSTDSGIAYNLLESLERHGIELADKSFLGLGLSRPGLSKEGKLMSIFKRLIRLGSLGTYLDKDGKGTITTESDWTSLDFEERINGHVVAVMSLVQTKDGEK